jgi:hypothetical protein
MDGPGEIEVIEPRLRRLIDYWRSIAPGPGLLPGKEHFDPARIRDLLPHLWLIDVLQDGARLRYRYRLVGTAIVGSGSPVRPGLILEETSPATLLYDAVVRERRMDWRRGPPLFQHSKDVYELERAVLPFAADGHRVDLLVGMTLFTWADGHVY